MTNLNLSISNIGALSAKDADIKWEEMTTKYQSSVKRLQIRIAKATLNGNHGKAKSLQWLLTHSFDSKSYCCQKSNFQQRQKHCWS